MFYPYFSHYFYDILVISIALLAGKQLFHLKFSQKQFIAFIIAMMFCYQLNFYFIEDIGKEYKYIVLYTGMILSYIFILRLSLTAALIVIMTTTAFNGIWTNFNMLWMLKFLFDDYQAALDSKHIQYTCYTVTVCTFNSLIVLFKIHIFDIQKYN